MLKLYTLLFSYLSNVQEKRKIIQMLTIVKIMY